MFHINSTNKRDSILNFILAINSFFAAITVVLIFIFLFKESFLSIKEVNTSFIFSTSWHPTEGQYNIFAMILGTLFVSLGAIIISIPIGLFIAIFSVFYLNISANFFFRRIIELYCAIPSVIFGFWGVVNIVPWISKFEPPGYSLIAGIIILTLMIFPIISLNLIAAFETSSRYILKISMSLGLSKGTYIWNILVPYCKKHLISSALLALGRAIGETMAVLMVCGNIVKIPSSFFDPIRTLTANIALEMSYAIDIHRSVLFFSGIVLLLMVALIIIFLSRLEHEK